jgi:hypothetical protein
MRGSSFGRPAGTPPNAATVPFSSGRYGRPPS